MNMRTQRFGIVSRLPNNTERGYGRDYAFNPGGGDLWATWIADRFDPPVYVFREEGWENAYDLAAGAICEDIMPDDYGMTFAEMIDATERGEIPGQWHLDTAHGSMFGVDTEALHLVRLAERRAR